MSIIKFLPRDAKKAPLPDSVLAQMIDRQEKPEFFYAPDPLKHLMKSAREALPLFDGEILDLVTREIDYDPRKCYIHYATHGDCENEEFQKIFNRILGVSDQQWQRALEQREERKILVAAYERRRLEHQAYRYNGPYLSIVIHPSARPCGQFRSHHYRRLQDRRIDTRQSIDIQAPTAEAMGEMIKHHREIILEEFNQLEFLKNRPMDFFRYHRLPDEKYFYDAEGNLETR